LQDYFNKNQIPAMNFIREIPNEAEYFIDYQHLTPKGYEFLATDISIKLNGMNL
jgi:lysophospholipase L1-like esterase